MPQVVRRKISFERNQEKRQVARVLVVAANLIACVVTSCRLFGFNRTGIRGEDESNSPLDEGRALADAAARPSRRASVF